MHHPRLTMARVNRDFRSDNTQGASPEIFEALARAGAGTMASYGRDEITDRVRARCCELFETEVEIVPVVTGTAGNALAIASMTPPGGVILCHEDAHIERDENGAPAFFTGGARLVTIPGADGKLHAADLLAGQPERLSYVADVGQPLRLSVDCLSLTTVTEAGTLYRPDEIRALTAAGDFGVHLDGARFANAVASLNCAPADITWRAGVDVMVFGGTKNGLINAELIVVFKKELAKELAGLVHRSGHRVSKSRFLAAQFEAYFTNDLWLRNARHANAMAARLARELDTIHETQANVVFARFEKHVADALMAEGFEFFDWPIFGDDAYRLVTGFATTEADVDAFLTAWARVPRTPRTSSEVNQ
jgi:threonine aldolase